MPTISELKAQTDQPRTGVWFDLLAMAPAGDERDKDKLYVCVAPRPDRAVMRAARDLARSVVRNGGKIEDGVAETAGRAAHIVDWQNLTDEDGEPIPCTPDRAYRLLSEDWPDVSDDIALLVLAAAQSASRAEEAESGN